MDCLICFKIFIKEKEYENISPAKGDICARSICKLLEIPNSHRIQDIFQDPVICSKCYQRLEDFHKELVQFEELERQNERIGGDVRKDLENSKNVSQVMQNSYGGQMSKSTKDRLQLLEVIKNKPPNSVISILQMDPHPQETPIDQSTTLPLSPQPKFIPNMGHNSSVKERPKKSEESSKNFICSECGSPHSSEDELNAHLESAITSKNIKKCSLCSEEFWGNQCFEFHKKDSHLNKNPASLKSKAKRGKIFECPECRIRFKSSGSLYNHRVIHGPKKFKCSFLGCGIKFHRKDYLKSHLYYVHDKPKQIKLKESLRIHENTNNQKKYQCQFCSRDFWNMKQMSSHLGDEKSEYCEICKEDFKSNGCFRHHNSISHGLSYYSHSIYSTGSPESKFKCPKIGCEKLFTRLYFLKEHIKVVHNGIKYKCKFVGCKKEFTQKSHLNRHERIVHK